MRHQLGFVVLKSRGLPAGRNRQVRGSEFSKCILRHSGFQRIRHGGRGRHVPHHASPLVCVLHMGRLRNSDSVLILAFHSVHVRHQSAVPLVHDNDVCFDDYVHGLLTCHGDHATHATRSGMAQYLLSHALRPHARHCVDSCDHSLDLRQGGRSDFLLISIKGPQSGHRLMAVNDQHQ